MQIGIIGGGLAGLVCAWRLVEAGLQPPVLLEKNASLGGRTRTAVYDGVAIELGAQTFSKSYRRFRELVAALDLKPQIKRVPMLQEAVYANGQVLSLANALSSDLFSRKELLLIAKLGLGGGKIEWPPGDAFQALHHLSWREHLEQDGYGANVIENFLDPLARLVTHQDSRGVSAAFGRFLASLMNTPKFILRDGFQAVIDALEARLRPTVEILTGTEVRAIVPQDGRFVLECLRAGETSQRILDVVVATPPLPVLNRLFPALPVRCAYASSLHLVVRGQRKPLFGEVYFLATAANPHGVFSCIGNGDVFTILAEGPGYDLDFLFDAYEVLEALSYEHGIALMTPGYQVPSLEPGPNNFYLCGDFYYYPSVEAAVVSAEAVAQRISERYG